MSSANKSLKKPIVLALIFTILMVGLLSLPAIVVNFRPQYREHLEIRVSLDRPASFLLQMPFILMDGKLTPSFVEIDLDDEDLFSGDENVVLDAEDINGSLYFKFYGFGQKMNLTSDFSSGSLSTQDYARLKDLHEFTYSEDYNMTHFLIPIFFNSTLSNQAEAVVGFKFQFTYSFDTCSNKVSDPLEMTLLHGWAKYPVPKSMFLSSCD